MKIHLLREIDIFGTDIKWRFMSRDDFKSMFGAVMTLLLVGLLGLKLFFFVTKTNDYGFAKKKINHQFKGDFQFLDMSEMRMIVYSDLENRLLLHRKKTNSTINPRSYFNISDFIELSFSDGVDYNQTTKLQMTEDDCATNQKFNIIQDFGSREMQAKFKCVMFKENNDFLNITKNETYILKSNGEPSKIQLDSLFQVNIEFRMKDNLISLLNSTGETFYLTIMISNFKVNPQNFMLEEQFTSIYLPLDLYLQTGADINFNKLSVTKKYQFDIFEPELSNEDKFQVSQNSLKLYRSFEIITTKIIKLIIMIFFS